LHWSSIYLAARNLRDGGNCGKLERQAPAEKRGAAMMVMLILPVFVIIALVATLPIWPHSKKWGFYPIGGISAVILIILYLYWTGRL
jgi:Protein of unknown function (DUF3309)